MISEKDLELLADAVSSDKVSDCCSASVYAPTDTWAICMDCKEHCGVVEAE